MTPRFNNKIQTTILIGSVLMVSACASIKGGDAINKAGDTVNTGETIANQADGMTRTTIPKGQFVSPIDSAGVPQPSGAVKVNDMGKNAVDAAQDSAQASGTIAARITPKERFVNVRSAASTKSRIVATLKGGHAIEVLETRDSWVKISWQKGNTVKHGWLKKTFVEGSE